MIHMLLIQGDCAFRHTGLIYIGFCPIRIFHFYFSYMLKGLAVSLIL